MRMFLKRRKIEAADTPFMIAVLETANHVAASEIDKGFRATSSHEGKKLIPFHL